MVVLVFWFILLVIDGVGVFWLVVVGGELYICGVVMLVGGLGFIECEVWVLLVCCMVVWVGGWFKRINSNF